MRQSGSLPTRSDLGRSSNPLLEDAAGSRESCLKPAIVSILLVELCERFSFYTLNGSQRNFLMDKGFSQSEATSITLTFGTAVYVFCIPGGILGDSYFGRFLTIASSS